MGRGVRLGHCRWLVLSIAIQSASASNKYCAFEVDGEVKYYICPRNENCCSIGCCVNLAFHFYQLWYYWLLVIFMFMVCSGGGWWYRFCRSSAAAAAGHSTTATSANPSRYAHHSHPSSGIITSHTLHGSNGTSSTTTSNLRSNRPHYHHSSEHCHQHQMIRNGHQRARIVHRPCGQRSMYYLQRIWKGPNAIQQQLPPSYSTMFVNLATHPSSNNTTDSSGNSLTRENSESQNPRSTICPYYQLYGPPPSYDSVIQLTTDGTASRLVEPSSSSVTTNCEGAAASGVEGTAGNQEEEEDEEIIQEIVISEPHCARIVLGVTTTPFSSSPSNCVARVDDGVEDEEDIVDVEMPLISVKCSSSKSTQPEDYNSTSNDDVDEEEEGVVLTTTVVALDAPSTATVVSPLHSSSSSGSNATSTAVSVAHRDYEDIPSTSSS